MPANSKIEQILKSLIFIGLLALVIIIFSQKIQFTSSDLGRHLENGKMIWQDQQLLFTNFYSYTEPNASFINHHWLAGIIFYGLYLLGGFKLLSAFNVLVAVITFGLIFNFTRKKSSFYLASTLALPVIFLLSERVEVRPEIFSYLFLILTWILIDRVATDKKYRRLLWLLPLFLVWVNIHIYFFLGLALLGFKLAAEFLPGFLATTGQFKGRLYAAWAVAKPWGKTFIYVALVCLINPNTWRGLLYPFNILRNYGYEIAENKSIFYLSHLLINYNFAIFKFLLFLLIVSFLIHYLIVKKISIFDIFLAIFFSALALFASRNLVLFGLISWVLISQNLTPLQSFVQNLLPLSFTYLRRFSFIPIGILLGAIILSGVYLIFDYSQQSNFIKTELGWGLVNGSADSVEFFQNNALEGPIFNNYDLGSALTFWLYPSERVFVDNRPEAYSNRFFTEIYKPMQTDYQKWQMFNEQYKFKTIYFSYTDSTPWAQQFLSAILSDADWSLVYFDRYVVILVNKKATAAAKVERLALDVWAFRDRLRALVTASDLKGKFQLASLALMAGQSDLAGEIYQEISFNYPGNRQVLSAFAYLYAASSDRATLTRSLGYFQKSLEAGYRLPGIYNQMGLVNWQLGEYQKAEANWRSALHLDKHDASALYYLNQLKTLQTQGQVPLFD